MTIVEQAKCVEACGTAMTMLLSQLARKSDERDKQSASSLVSAWDALMSGGDPGPQVRAMVGMHKEQR